MNWTHTTPTKPGVYWFRFGVQAAPIIVHVGRGSTGLVAESIFWPRVAYGLKNWRYQSVGRSWAGPIPSPG